jgi:hypothetical protein
MPPVAWTNVLTLVMSPPSTARSTSVVGDQLAGGDREQRCCLEQEETSSDQPKPVAVHPAQPAVAI